MPGAPLPLSVQVIVSPMNPDEFQNLDPNADLPEGWVRSEATAMEPEAEAIAPTQGTPDTVPEGAVAPLSLSDPSAVASRTSGVSIEVSALTPLNQSAENQSAENQSAETSAASALETDTDENEAKAIAQRVDRLRQQEAQLKRDIADLQTAYNRLVREQLAEAQLAVERWVTEGLGDLEQRRQTLQLSVDQLERRQERIRAEMRTTFAGSSQDVAIRIQGFKDYLVGSLQDLVVAAEELKLTAPTPALEAKRPAGRDREREEEAIAPQFAEQGFQEQNRQIRKLLDQYRTAPDYYGAAWQLRRTFEPIHAERVANWFFTQGGKGALRTMGSRLQNILIASTIISILRKLYGPRVRMLILADSPERLGEWRRGLQDCLGISRSDFGSDQGVVLFEAPEPLAQRADRLVKQKQLPLIIMDESEDVVNLSLLQFPMWLAFATDPAKPMMY